MDIQGMDVGKKTPIQIWSGRTDYNEKFSSSFALEAGIKGTLSSFNNNVDVSEKADNTWSINPLLTNQADLTEKIGALYASANWSPAEDLQITGGLRYEYTDNLLTTADRQTNIHQEYGNFFPVLSIDKKLGEIKSIGASYSRRITRPTFNDMAPFVFFLSPNTYISGNPSLKPAVSDGFKLDYQHTSWLASLQYTYTQNEIGAFQPEINLATNKQVYRSQNLDYLQTVALSAAIPFTLVS